MKLITKNTFILNGVEEKILKMPVDRNDTITITMNGQREHAQTIPLDVFEYNTDMYIMGLEPERNIDSVEQLRKLEKHLRDNDFNVTFDGKKELRASIEFVNGSNSKMYSGVYLTDHNDGFIISVSKTTYGTERKQFHANKNNIDFQVDRAIEQVNKFISQKVQVISKEIPKDHDREFDDNNIPILKHGESLDEYFKSHSDTKHAGIVLTSNREKYVPFVSFFGVGNKRHLSHETKSYKRLNGAVKFLNGFGYDAEGKKKEDVFDIQEIKEVVRDYSQRHVSITSGEDFTAEVSTNNGYVIYDEPRISISEELGAQCFIDFKYVRESDGREYRDSIEVTHELDGRYSLSQPIFLHCFDVESGLNDGKLSFQEDTRTSTEKYKYHADIIKSCNRSIERYKERAQNDPEFWNRLIKEQQEKIDLHKSSAKALKAQGSDKTLDI